MSMPVIAGFRPRLMLYTGCKLMKIFMVNILREVWLLVVQQLYLLHLKHAFALTINCHNGGLSSFSAGIEVKTVIHLNSRNEFISTSFRGYRLLFRRI